LIQPARIRGNSCQGCRKDFISLAMRCEETQHPGSAGSCQPSDTGLAAVWAKAVASAACRPAEFLYPTGAPPGECSENYAFQMIDDMS
jgi:hypothetical protein